MLDELVEAVLEDVKALLLLLFAAIIVACIFYAFSTIELPGFLEPSFKETVLMLEGYSFAAILIFLALPPTAFLIILKKLLED